MATDSSDPLQELLDLAEAAREVAGEVLDESRLQIIRFRCGERAFALPIECVERTERIPTITPVPRAPDWVRGLASLRGGVVCIVDLMAMLSDGSSRPQSEPNSLLLLSKAGRRLGLLSDELPDFERIDPDEFLRVARTELEVYTAALERDGDLVALLDPDKVLDSVEERLSHVQL